MKPFRPVQELLSVGKDIESYLTVDIWVSKLSKQFDSIDFSDHDFHLNQKKRIRFDRIINNLSLICFLTGDSSGAQEVCNLSISFYKNLHTCFPSVSGLIDSAVQPLINISRLKRLNSNGRHVLENISDFDWFLRSDIIIQDMSVPFDSLTQETKRLLITTCTYERVKYYLKNKIFSDLFENKNITRYYNSLFFFKEAHILDLLARNNFDEAGEICVSCLKSDSGDIHRIVFRLRLIEVLIAAGEKDVASESLKNLMDTITSKDISNMWQTLPLKIHISKYLWDLEFFEKSIALASKTYSDSINSNDELRMAMSLSFLIEKSVENREFYIEAFGRLSNTSSYTHVHNVAGKNTATSSFNRLKNKAAISGLRQKIHCLVSNQNIPQSKMGSK